MDDASNYRIVYITTESFDNAKHLSKILVTEKLAACCTIVQNAMSIYAWGSAVQERFESLIIVKTLADRYQDLEARILQIHSDEVPEIIAISVSEGSESYLNWISQVLHY